MTVPLVLQLVCAHLLWPQGWAPSRWPELVPGDLSDLFRGRDWGAARSSVFVDVTDVVGSDAADWHSGPVNVVFAAAEACSSLRRDVEVLNC